MEKRNVVLAYASIILLIFQFIFWSRIRTLITEMLMVVHRSSKKMSKYLITLSNESLHI